ncbi:MAG: phospholipase D family protein [Halioglobus sp.]
MRAALLALLLVSLSACNTLPDAPQMEVELAFEPSLIGDLADIAGDIAPQHSSFYLLPRALDAMNWRLALIDSAELSIDIQYFIWKDDASGALMLEHLFAAADRGVKVRMIVDDMFLSTGGAFSGADEALAAISFHPNIQLSLFNPGKYRDGIAGLAGNFGGSLKDYNRRMHNKLMVFDGLFTVVGGRNIGDEYFGLHEPYNFVDLDLLATGIIANESSTFFDQYWNSDLVYPAAELTDMDTAGYETLRLTNSDYVRSQSGRLQVFSNEARDEAYYVSVLHNEMSPGFAVFLQDEPVLRGKREFRLADMLGETVLPGVHEVVLSSPYLIPVEGFLESVLEDVNAGVEVSLLTNSLASNDATPAHSHYKKYRQNILATGAKLYEFHHEPIGGMRKLSDAAPGLDTFVALHTKAFSVDGMQCFIGSLNIDPRSVNLNTENGIYIESSGVCGQLSRLLYSFTTPENAWSVSLNEKNKLKWSSYEGSVTTQPALGLGQRISDFFFRLLPVERQL